MSELLNEIEANEICERYGLAVVYKVERLEPIPNKDRIELVHLKDCGFTSICEKRYKVGDLVIFIKYDTALPKNELFEFTKDFKYRVKAKSFTEKDNDGNVVKKIYSQGIVLPVAEVSKFLGLSSTYPWLEGDDVTSLLGVTKYIPPVLGGCGGGMGDMRAKGYFPVHIISKTDEINLASKMRALDEIKGKDVYISLKIEGSSFTTYLDEIIGEQIVCSRNMMLQETEGSKFWNAANKYNLKEELLKYPWIVLQGELYGPGIQKNKLGMQEVDVLFFNFIDKRKRKRLSLDEMDKIAIDMNINLVPILCRIGCFDWSFEKLQEYADIQKYANGETAEGIVVRPVVPFTSQITDEDWSFKVINRNYQL